MHLKDEIIKETNRVEIVQTLFRRLESSRGLQDLLGREKDAIRTQQAARMLELEKKLAEYREKYGVFPGGEKAAREVLLSKKSGANEKISQTVRTILETKATPEEMVPDIMELAMEGKYSCEEASREVVADACEMMLGNSTVVEQLAKENRSLAEKIRDWLREWVENLKIALESLQADRTESRAMMQYARELQEIWDNALMDAARNNRGAVEAESRQQARVGTDAESGKPIYQSNFPKGTPKAAKAQRILSLIQNVWSKKPISLVVQDADGSTRTIEARFDPTYIEEEGVQTDAKKLMGGNRHGTSGEQRVTLDLADDYYEIAVESTYNYSKSETGKSSATHEGVKQWHYFVNDILFQEYGEKETTPYRVTINVKERSDGEFVYSFSAERQNERSSTRRTLHADVNQTAKGGEANAQPSVDSIRQSNDNSQEKSSDNKNPTADPDIRYQQRDNLKEEYHLTDDEESAIISYKSGDSYTLNGKLTAKAELTEYQRKLRDNLDAALEKLPVYRGEVYRHYNFDDFGGFDAMQGFLRLFRKGKYIDLGGYLSCSTVRNEDRTQGEYTVNMVIQSENGRRLAGFGRNTENEILLPRDTQLVPYRMERMGKTSIRIYVREDTNGETGKTNDSALPDMRGMREGTQGGENLRQVPGGDPGKVQSEVGRSAGRDGDRRGVPGLREGEGSGTLDATGVDENHRGPGTRGGEGEDVKNQQREPRLSDRDVLSLAADMALRQQNKSWTPEDRNRLEIFTVRLRRLEEAQAELKALKEERKDLLDGRKASEVTKDERLELTQNRNRTDLAKKNVEKREAQLYEIESIEAVKTLLRKSREVVEKETAFKARQRYREKTEDRQRYQVLKRRLERTTNEWKRMLLKPTKDRYAPEELVRSCLEVALMLDESGRRLAGFGKNTENEILLPRDTKLVPYRMERMGPTSIRVYVREETISDAGKTNDSALSGVRGMRKGTQRSENLRQVSGGNPGKVQSEMGRSAGRDGDRGGMPGLREGEGSASLDATGVEENHRGYETRGGEGEGVKN